MWNTQADRGSRCSVFTWPRNAHAAGVRARLSIRAMPTIRQSGLLYAAPLQWMYPNFDLMPIAYTSDNRIEPPDAAGLEIVSSSAIRKPFARDCASHASRCTLKVKRRLPRVIIFSKIILNFLIRRRGAQAPNRPNLFVMARDPACDRGWAFARDTVLEVSVLPSGTSHSFLSLATRRMAVYL
jgi:hypothetical protein